MSTASGNHPSPAVSQRYDVAAIEADPTVPAFHIRRDFRAPRARLLRAHIDPEVFVRWIGPDGFESEVVEWDARDGGAWRYTTRHGEHEGSFRGCFHTVAEDRIVQTFTWDGMPDAVLLETLTFEELGDDRTRLHAFSLCASFAVRDQWLTNGMDVGVHEGYAALDRLLAAGT